MSWNDTSARARPSAVSARLTPFVERDAERASLRRLVDDALAGHGGWALVAGEPGVGKSRLVAEIGDEAQAGGMRVLAGHCVEMSGAPPYLPYVEMIEQAISNPRSPLALRGAWRRGPDRPYRAALGRLSRHPAASRVPAELSPLSGTASEFIGRAAQVQPLVLVLEDLHWADESTVLLTEYLAPLLPEMPVLVLGYRDAEVDLSIRWPSYRAAGIGACWNGCLRRLSRRRTRMLRALAGQPRPSLTG